MKLLKKIIPALLAVSMLPAAAQAATFPDMPQDDSRESLERAVDNGLLSGFEDGTIRPGNNITRAQMATIITRSFGAQDAADISDFTDISEDDWFYDAFAQAVQMGAFNGDDQKHLNPTSYINFQECFKVISSVFGLIANTEDKYPTNDLQAQDLSVLDKFTDSDDISDWAKPYVAAIVSGGYWDGVDTLNPKAYITRAQFAVLMDRMVTTYINEPGTYTDLPTGNIMIKSNGVNIDGLNSESYCIISDGVSADGDGVKFTNSTLNSRLVIRGGGQKTSFSGFLKDFVILNPNLNISVSISNLKTVTGYIKYDSSSWTYSFGG